jgi:hypothetical protein
MKVRFVTIGVLFALLAGACGGGGDKPLHIGLQRIALDLAFKAETEDKPQPQQVVLPTVIPSQAEFAVVVPPATFDEPVAQAITPPVRPFVPTCPVAPEGAVPEQAVTQTVTAPPASGVYKVHRVGTFAIQSAVFPFQGNMPPKGEKEYRNVKVIPGAVGVLGDKAPDQFEYEIFEQTGDNFTSRTVRTTPTAIQLVKQVTKVGGTTVTFTPTPAITLVALGASEGSTWNSAGVDTANGTSMVVQGTLVRRENVDVCGTVYDTWMAQTTERVTNLTQQYSSQTNDTGNAADPATGAEAGKPNTYWVATQFGGLFLQEDFHTTTTLTVDVNGAPVPVTLKLDYRNTFDALAPAGPAHASS